jgi:L-iditol 2-dehydrogenase
MKVARLFGRADLRVVEEEAPRPGPGTSLVRITSVGLCGSDLHWYAEAGIGDARLTRPLVVGHEMAGVIEGGRRHGERVAVDPALPCEQCAMCRAGHPNLCPTVRFAGHGRNDGGMREFVAWPDRALYPLPDVIDDDGGAMLEPLGVAVHAMDLGHVALGASVGVFGCGPIGLLIVQLARAAGASLVLATDPLPHRREAALRCGADYVWDPATGAPSDEVVESVAGLGVDVAFEVAGSNDAVGTALRAARPGARVVLVGIPDDDRTTFSASLARRKGLTLVLSRRMKDVYPRAIALVERGRVDLSALVTDRYPLVDAAKAFTAAVARTGLKTVIRPADATE